MCAALTLDRLAHRGICRPLHPAHQTKGCSLWRSENREGLSLNKCFAYMLLLLSHCSGGRGRENVAKKLFESTWKKGSHELSCRLFPFITLRSHIIILVYISRQGFLPRGGGHTSTTNLTVLQKHEKNKRKELNLKAGGGKQFGDLCSTPLVSLSLSAAV